MSDPRERQCQEWVTQSKASEVVDQEAVLWDDSPVGPCPGPHVMVQEYALCVCPRLAYLYIYLSAYCFYFQNVRRRIFIAFEIRTEFIGLKCDVCGERWVL